MFEYWKYNTEESDNSEEEDMIFNKEIDIPNDLTQYYELTIGFGLPKDKDSWIHIGMVEDLHRIYTIIYHMETFYLIACKCNPSDKEYTTNILYPFIEMVESLDYEAKNIIDETKTAKFITSFKYKLHEGDTIGCGYYNINEDDNENNNNFIYKIVFTINGKLLKDFITVKYKPHQEKIFYPYIFGLKKYTINFGQEVFKFNHIYSILKDYLICDRTVTEDDENNMENENDEEIRSIINKKNKNKSYS
eukprot:jgi/Orpsp1_1/1189663/evm.model.d7180000073591.1